jgi:transcription elongation factor GreA
MADKKHILTYAGLKKYEDELQDLKVNRRREIAQKIKEAREQGDLSENAEYDAAKDEQRDIEARIEEIEKLNLGIFLLTFFDENLNLNKTNYFRKNKIML